MKPKLALVLARHGAWTGRLASRKFRREWARDPCHNTITTKATSLALPDGQPKHSLVARAEGKGSLASVCLPLPQHSLLFHLEYTFYSHVMTRPSPTLLYFIGQE